MHRSVSQVLQAESCPKQYELSRLALDDKGERLWQRPAAWFPHGTAFHYAAEAWELSDRSMTIEAAQEIFAERYERDVNLLTWATPNLAAWFGSGPYYPAEKDIPRRFHRGMEQVRWFIEYYQKHPHIRPWLTPQGSLAVELPFSLRISGIKVIGKIDCVYYDSLNKLYIIEDWKTGAKPGDWFQLKVYEMALTVLGGLVAPNGRFFMARSGSPTTFYNLSRYSSSEVARRFVDLDERARRGEFPAMPDPQKCRTCSVAWACNERA